VYQGTQESELGGKRYAEVGPPGLLPRAGSILDLLRRVAPKMMARADANWGFGVASIFG